MDDTPTTLYKQCEDAYRVLGDDLFGPLPARYGFYGSTVFKGTTDAYTVLWEQATGGLGPAQPVEDVEV